MTEVRSVEPVALAQGVAIAETTESAVTDVACRVLDIVVSATLLVLLLPFIAIAALAIRLDSPGPALFRQRRLGHRMQPFMVNKFRTMTAGARDDTHREYIHRLIEDGETAPDGERGLFKLEADDRVTRLGRFLRRSSIDELPQLWNVLCGHMSLVGPRPPIPYEVERYPAEWFARFAVKPGLTGLWQISGRSELGLHEMVGLDVEYVARRSFWFNVSILAHTVPVVLNGRGAV